MRRSPSSPYSPPLLPLQLASPISLSPGPSQHLKPSKAGKRVKKRTERVERRNLSQGRRGETTADELLVQERNYRTYLQTVSKPWTTQTLTATGVISFPPGLLAISCVDGKEGIFEGKPSGSEEHSGGALAGPGISKSTSNFEVDHPTRE